MREQRGLRSISRAGRAFCRCRAPPPVRCRGPAPPQHRKRELEYRIPRFHSPGLSKISARTKQASCKYLWKTFFSGLLPQTSVENRSPYPVLKSSLTSGGWKCPLLEATHALALMKVSVYHGAAETPDCHCSIVTCGLPEGGMSTGLSRKRLLHSRRRLRSVHRAVMWPTRGRESCWTPGCIWSGSPPRQAFSATRSSRGGVSSRARLSSI